MNNLYLSPCSQRPSLAARERQHLGFDHLKTWTDIPYLVTVYQLHLAQSFFRDTLSHSAALLYSTTTIKDCLFHMQHIFELHSHTLFFLTDIQSVFSDSFLFFFSINSFSLSLFWSTVIYRLASRCQWKFVVTVWWLWIETFWLRSLHGIFSLFFLSDHIAFS